jgi:uncharacterized protein (DUF1330 family)
LNRSLLSFLVFLAVLLVGFAIASWWVGPAMVTLAFDEDRRNQPYYLVHLITLEDDSGYFQSLGQLLREEEAQLLWRGGLAMLHAGRSEDELRDLAFIEFSQGGGVVQMMTSSAYRDLTAANAPILLGATAAPGPIAQDETLLLWLFELTDRAAGDVVALLWESAAAYEGQLVWSTAVDVLEGDRGWSHLLLLAFPDGSAIEAWLGDPETATNRALLRRHYVSEALMELTAG